MIDENEEDYQNVIRESREILRRQLIYGMYVLNHNSAPEPEWDGPNGVVVRSGKRSSVEPARNRGGKRPRKATEAQQTATGWRYPDAISAAAKMKTNVVARVAVKKEEKNALAQQKFNKFT